MDRNQLTGLIIMLALITVYFQFFAPEPTSPVVSEPIEEVGSTTDSIAADTPTVPVAISDSIIDAGLLDQYGVFANASKGTEQKLRIETDELILTFTNRGGDVEEVTLKNHFLANGDMVTLFDESSSDIDLVFSSENRIIPTGELFFNTTTNDRQLNTGDSLEITYQTQASNGGLFIKKYTIYGSGFLVGYSIETTNLNAAIDNTDLDFTWRSEVKSLESDVTDERNRTTVKYFSVANDDIDYLSETSTGTEQEDLNELLKWVSIKQKFFTSAILADGEFQRGYVETSIPADPEKVKNTQVQMAIPIGDIKAGGAGFRYYFGPNDYNTLDEVAPGFWKNVSLGWGIFGLVNKFMVIPIFSFLDGIFDNYGIIIVLLVLVVRLILAPLTFKSHMSMAKMKVLKPELDEIREKHDGDMQKAQAEQMQLYQKVGINPLSGCIPLVLQMPILLAMFYFFPNAIQLRQQSFLWANDLSTYDSILSLPFTIPFYGDHVSLFTLLMTASTILYTWSNSQVQTVQGPMKSVQYVMPVMFLFFLNNYASGLTYYYFLTNIASFGQIALFRKFVDDDKIMQKLEENRKKNANKKKSNFQSRLEEAMKASQEQQRKRKQKKK